MYKAKITKEEINALPVTGFEGEITVVDRPSQVGRAVEALRGHDLIGIDTETKPSFTKGQHHKVALVQLATEEHCFLFRLNKLGFPAALEELLADKNVKKVGLSLHDDMTALCRRRRFKPAGIIDLQSIARDYGIMELGLQKMYAIIFGEKMSKAQQLSNWENDALTPAQQRYAATDAWACLKIYRRLKGLPRISADAVDALLAEYGC